MCGFVVLELLKNKARRNVRDTFRLETHQAWPTDQNYVLTLWRAASAPSGSAVVRLVSTLQERRIRLWMVISGPNPLSDSVPRSDQLLGETSGGDQWNRVTFDFSGLLHWFPVSIDPIAGLRLNVDQAFSHDRAARYWRDTGVFPRRKLALLGDTHTHTHTHTQHR